MRRVIMGLVVLAILVATALPAMAQGWGNNNDWGHNNNDWGNNNNNDRWDNNDQWDNNRWDNNNNVWCSWYPSWWGWNYWCYSPWWGWWQEQ